MRRFRDPEKEILDRAELDVAHYTQQLDLAIKEGWPMKAILDHKMWIASALTVLGRYEEARAMATFESGLVRVKDKPKLNKLAKEIDETAAAVDEDDNAYCDCRHIVDLSPVPSQPQLRELSSYSPTGRKTKSAKHGGKLVELYKCIYCGHTNALLEPPDTMLKVANSIRFISDAAPSLQPDFAKADHIHYAKA